MACNRMALAGKWWATLESNQARVAPGELQSPAAPCSSSPTHWPLITARPGRRQECLARDCGWFWLAPAHGVREMEAASGGAG